MDTKEKSQERKKGRINGKRSQKVVSFRLDTELEFWLACKPNKGRYINELILKDMQALS